MVWKFVDVAKLGLTRGRKGREGGVIGGVFSLLTNIQATLTKLSSTTLHQLDLPELHHNDAYDATGTCYAIAMRNNGEVPGRKMLAGPGKPQKLLFTRTLAGWRGVLHSKTSTQISKASTTNLRSRY